MMPVPEQSLLEQAIAEAGGAEQLAAVLSPGERQRCAYDPTFLGRPCQLAPAGVWRTWLFLAGRGAGKSWSGAQRVRTLIESGQAGRVGLVGATAADCRDVMVEGPSGLLQLSPPAWRPVFEPSKRRLLWGNGATALLLSAEEPERARGVQFDAAWADEVGAWAAGGDEMWANLEFAVRSGDHPTITATTTPRPTKLVRGLLAEPGTVVTRSTTFDNSHFLAPSYLEAITRMYANTRLGKQEIFGLLLEDRPGALFRRGDIDAARVARAPELRRVVVGVDPSASSTATSDECGIVTMGVGPCPCRGAPEPHGFVLADWSAVLSPAGWAAAVRRAYDHHRADRIIAEKNCGGDMVSAVLRAHGGAHLPITLVSASRGKAVRAEPIAALVEQRKVHFVGGLPHLEDQLCEWDPSTDRSSPDRLDAFVWAASALMLGGGQAPHYTSRRGRPPLLPRRM